MVAFCLHARILGKGSPNLSPLCGDSTLFGQDQSTVPQRAKATVKERSPGEFRVSSLSRRAPSLCLDSQPAPTSDSDSDSELYCPRTEILGNSLFLQSVLSKLLKKQNPKNKKIRTQILTDTIDEHNIIKRHNSLLILQIHTVS